MTGRAVVLLDGLSCGRDAAEPEGLRVNVGGQVPDRRVRKVQNNVVVS